MTHSTRWVAVWATRQPAHEGQKPCRLQRTYVHYSRVEIEYNTCRLTLLSTTRGDCLEEAELPRGPDPNDF
jgi:hypothetical protein